MTMLPEKIAGAELILPASMLFLLTIVGFAIKLPVFPLHTWLPDAHTDAPTAASVMLAGVLLKMGGYGMFRVSAFMFPEQINDYSWMLAVIGVFNIMGAFPAWELLTAIAAITVVLTAGYILWMVQRTVFGLEIKRYATINDATIPEIIPIAILIVTIISVGIYPAFISDIFRDGIVPIVEAIP